MMMGFSFILLMLAIGVVVGALFLYAAIKMFHHVVSFGTVCLVVLLSGLAETALNIIVHNSLLAAVGGFIVMGLLLKAWSSIETWGQVFLVALVTTLLKIAVVFGTVLLLVGLAASHA